MTRRRPWTPDQIRANNDGTLSRTISPKRRCNGCRTKLGDLTEVEMVAAVRDGPQRPVTHECGLCQGVHVVFANPDARAYDWDPEDGDTYTIEVLCPGKRPEDVVLPCAAWERCGCTPAAGVEWPSSEFEQFIEQPCPASPTGEHRYFPELNLVGAPTGGCWYQQCDGTQAAVQDLLDGPGMYPVHVDAIDDTTPVFEPADLAARRDATVATA